jgi:hypothetical protein
MYRKVRFFSLFLKQSNENMADNSCHRETHDLPNFAQIAQADSISPQTSGEDVGYQ